MKTFELDPLYAPADIQAIQLIQLVFRISCIHLAPPADIDDPDLPSLQKEIRLQFRDGVSNASLRSTGCTPPMITRS